MKDFLQIAGDWEKAKIAGIRFPMCEAERRILHRLMAPETREWFQACCSRLRGGPSPDDYPVIRNEILPALDTYIKDVARDTARTDPATASKFARLHVDLAQVALNAGHWPSGTVPFSAVSDLASAAGVPSGLLLDILEDMRSCVSFECKQGKIAGGILRPAWRRQEITAPLVERRAAPGHPPEDVGVIATLTIELMPKGTGEVYPIPGLCFVDLDPDFRCALDNAFRQGEIAERLKRQDLDVRWRLERTDLKALPLRLKGDSIGLAAAVGLKMALTDPSKKPNLCGVVFTAAIDAGGRLHKVGSIFEKLLESVQKRTVPRMHTLLVAQEQLRDIEAIHPNLLKDDPHASFAVFPAQTPDEAIDRIRVDLKTRWGRIPDFTPELDRHRVMVGRDWLKERIHSFVHKPDGGYLLLTAGPGFGKTCFVAEMVRESDGPLVYHLLKKGYGDWDRQVVLLNSLTAQLQRYHLKSPLDLEPGMTAFGAFYQTLQDVSRELQPGEKVVIYIDGLDEAFGPTARDPKVALPGILPKVPPEGIKIVLTSRPGEFLNWLADETIVERQSMDPQSKENASDLRAYLRQQNESRGLGMSEQMIELLVSSSEGYFMAAVLYLRERSNLKSDLETWAQDPLLIPRGLIGWMTEQWERVTDASRRKRISPDLVAGLLGVMAMAQEPLSREHITAFLAAPGTKRGKTAGTDRSSGFIDTRKMVRHANALLEITEEYFDARDTTLGPAAPYRFFHTSFQEFIAFNKLSEVERRDCHGILERGCAAWNSYQGAVREYALRHRLAHLITARNWSGFGEVFSEAAFILARNELEQGFVGIHGDICAALAHKNLPAEWHLDLSAWERFLRFRLERLKQFPAAYGQEVINEFLFPNVDSLTSRTFTASLKNRTDNLTRSLQFQLRKRSGPKAIVPLGHTRRVCSVSFSPDGRRVASGSDDDTVKVWDAGSGALVANCVGHTRRVNSVSFSPDGRRVASGSGDQTVKVWAAETGTLVTNCVGHTNDVVSVTFSPNGRYVASASFDKSVKVWDVETGALVAVCVGHTNDVVSVTFSPDGRHVASASFDKSVKVWDAETGELVADCVGHTDFVNSVSFSPDGRRVASGSSDGTVKIWDAGTGAPVADCVGHTWHVYSVSFSPDGRRVASGGSTDNAVRVWDAESGALLADCLGHTSGVESVWFSPDGRRVASGSSDRTIKVWNAETGTLVADCVGHANWMTSESFSPDGRRVASGSSDGTVKVWDAGTGALLADCVGHSNWMTSVSISPDGRRVASGSSEGAVKVWDAETGALLADCVGHYWQVNSVSFSPDGRRVASGSLDKTVKVWDAKTGALVAHFVGHTDHVNSVSFSPDGRRVASGSLDKTVKVWDAETGTLVANCVGQTGSINSVSFSPDGRRVASGSEVTTLKVWDAETGALVANCMGHTSYVRSVVSFRQGCVGLKFGHFFPQSRSFCGGAPAGGRRILPPEDFRAV